MQRRFELRPSLVEGDSAVYRSGLEAAGEGSAMKGTWKGTGGEAEEWVAERHRKLIVGGSNGRRVSIRVAKEVAMGRDYVDGERREGGGVNVDDGGRRREQ
ncbi:hypothetical protein EDB86DRAFT_2828853 [Lactarius hatsudake]|nr:hypothetical protein EDB86DRAFT_2828853 [Lactarius hatsudake]